MEFQDKSLNCVDCGTEFIWTAGEQLFFADKNFKNEPKRCKSCKAKRASRPAPFASPLVALSVEMGECRARLQLARLPELLDRRLVLARVEVGVAQVEVEDQREGVEV